MKLPDLDKDGFANGMILYRPVGLQELELIYEGGMKAFPASLPNQPIFYPVLDLEYARQVASDWNIKNGQFAGYVTQFKVEDNYASQFEEHTVGESQYQELWIPVEEMDEFNRHIIGHIMVVEAYFGDSFQGFVPEMFGLRGKHAPEQFTLLANSYVYKRMDFYLEIKRNHKAIFLNYPFWQNYEFKNRGLKEKVLREIRDAWLTSFPKIPLPLPPPVHEDTSIIKQTGTDSLPAPVHEEITPAKQTESHFAQGVKLGLSGKYHEAIEVLSKAVEEDPDHVVAHTSLGIAFHRLNEDDRALTSYDTALKVNPHYAEAHYFRANILYGHGDIREAIAGYIRAIGLEPELIDAHQNSVPQNRLTDYTHIPAEMYRIARPAHQILGLNKSLDTNPGQVNLFKERAANYYRLRNYEQAITDYSSSLALLPEDAGALHHRGLAYEQLGQFERALENYQQAIAIDPQLSDVYINRGVALGKTGNFRQSITSLTEGIRLAPQNPNAYFNRGTSYFRLGDFESAIADFSKVIQLSPNDEDAYYWRGFSNEEAGRQREAIADYRHFLDLSQNPQAREEIEKKLRLLNAGKQDSTNGRISVPDNRQESNQGKSEKPDHDLDLYDLINALGERALDSIWVGSGVNCYGEKAEDLYAFTDDDEPIDGRNLLHITSGIRQTMEGDFQAFDPGAASYWIFIRAWNGSGFYVETSDPKSKERLKSYFRSIEDVGGAYPPYEGLFIRI